MQKLKVLLLIVLTVTLSSCTKEAFTKKSIPETFTANTVKNFSVSTCSNMHFEKPPVDILFLVDNSGSTNMESFQSLKTQIAQTVNTVSNEFDYHIYVAPIIPEGTDVSSYPVIVSNPDSLTSPVTVQLTNLSDLTFFEDVAGSNSEKGFERAAEIVNANITNGVFRQNTNLVIVTISNGDDTTTFETNGGNRIPIPGAFNQKKEALLALTHKFNPQGTLKAESLRYLTLIAHTNCNGFSNGSNYKKMSSEIYSAMENSDDPSNKNSYDLCSGQYSTLFTSVNNSIRAVLVGHSYNHWKISSSQENGIEQSDIQITKVLENGNHVNIPQDATNGFEYLGHKTNRNTRYAPTPGEPVTGLVVRLNGNSRVTFPECIIAKTRTPTEYFGYVVLPREPELATLNLQIDGANIPQNSTNGWTYDGYHPTKNIKVPGPSNVSVTPEVSRTGYFLKLHGNAIYSNGANVHVDYKAAAF